MRQNLVGKRFGRLTVISSAPDIMYGKAKVPWAAWNCKCDCGKETVVPSGPLKSRIRSCGCARKQHGESKPFRTPEFISWSGMKQRCTNANRDGYEYYGERGIKVCKRWMKYENFLKDMGRKPSPEHSIERREPNGDYTPSNCYWGTVEQQQNNKRNNHLVEFDGKRMTCAQWDRHQGLPAGKVAYRLSAGWTVEDAIMTPNMIHMYRPG